jgi:hypothetical protein
VVDGARMGADHPPDHLPVAVVVTRRRLMSKFDYDVIKGPATKALNVYEVQEVGDDIQVRV